LFSSCITLVFWNAQQDTKVIETAVIMIVDNTINKSASKFKFNLNRVNKLVYR
jgi:hypothetical protein